MVFITGQKFEKENPSGVGLIMGEYENCVFSNCDLSEFDFSGFVFSDCIWMDCNLSLIKINKTAFRNNTFIRNKMLGIHFENCNPFGLSFIFEKCLLQHCSFYGLKLKKIKFVECDLSEVDFTDSELKEAIFNNCDLFRTTFENTNLEAADLHTSFRFTIDPELNRVKKTKFSSEGLKGLLEKYDLNIVDPF
jgi:fluoroquinolone resistance protein